MCFILFSGFPLPPLPASSSHRRVYQRTDLQSRLNNRAISVSLFYLAIAMVKRKSPDIATGAQAKLNGGKANGELKNRNAGTESNGNGLVRDAKRSRIEERTDYSRWRMRDDDSRHTWHYLEDDEEAKKWPQTYADKYYLGLPLVNRHDFLFSHFLNAFSNWLLPFSLGSS
jgi:hypothetical protein